MNMYIIIRTTGGHQFKIIIVLPLQRSRQY